MIGMRPVDDSGTDEEIPLPNVKTAILGKVPAGLPADASNAAGGLANLCVACSTRLVPPIDQTGSGIFKFTKSRQTPPYATYRCSAYSSCSTNL